MNESEAILRWYLAIKNAASYTGHCTFCRRPLLGLEDTIHPTCQALAKMDTGARL